MKQTKLTIDVGVTITLANYTGVISGPRNIVDTYPKTNVLYDLVGIFFVEIVLESLDGAFGKVLWTNTDKIRNFCL